MKKTVRDLEKAGAVSMKWLKTGLYYLYLPTVLILGLKTVNWEMLFGNAPSLDWYESFIITSTLLYSTAKPLSKQIIFQFLLLLIRSSVRKDQYSTYSVYPKASQAYNSHFLSNSFIFLWVTTQLKPFFLFSHLVFLTNSFFPLVFSLFIIYSYRNKSRWVFGVLSRLNTKSPGSSSKRKVWESIFWFCWCILL